MPLNGKKVLITRPEGSEHATIQVFEAAGAQVHNLPLIKTVPTTQYQSLGSTNALAQGFDVVVLGSPRGATMFCDKVKGPLHADIAAVGPGTARVVAQRLQIKPLVPATYDQEGLLNLLKPRLSPGSRVLYFGAADKRNVMGRGLHDAGVDVVEFAAYRTVCTTPEPKAVAGEIEWADYVCFFSPSGVRCMAQAIGRDTIKQSLAAKIIVAIGHVTARALQEIGVHALVPPAHTPASMVETLKKTQ